MFVGICVYAVLTNSIASINRWAKVREWLAQKMRLVAFFDLPPNVFAETGVNTSILIAYKPESSTLQELNKNGYSIFVKDIKRVGYEKRTSKRNVFLILYLKSTRRLLKLM